MVLEAEFPGDVRVDREVTSLYKNSIKVDVAIYTRRKLDAPLIKYKWGNVYTKYITKLNYKLSALALTLPNYFIFWKRFLEEILQKNSYDYIHLHDLPLIKVAKELSIKYNIPLIVDLHENRPEIMKLYKHVNNFPGSLLISTKKWNLYQEKYLKHVEKLILITPEAKDYYTTKLKVDSDIIHVVPNYINLPIITGSFDVNKLKKYESKKTVVYFGDLSERRGVMDVMRVAKIQKNNPLYYFVFIGTGSALKALKDYKAKQELWNVEILGFLSIETAMRVISSCSIGVCPFHRNIHHDTTYANKMFQYMALGLPLIVSDCPSQAKIVNVENAGVVYKAGDANDLNSKLEKLAEDEMMYNTISRRNKLLVKNRYNWNEAEKELLKIYIG